MQYRQDMKYGNQLSALGYGCMRFTRKGSVIDQEKAEKEMALALEKGVNYFDTAYMYPGSEVCLGKFIKKMQCRDRVYIATKLPHYRVKSVADAQRFFTEELERLQTDHVDYYLMHMLNDAASWVRLCSLGIREWIAEKKETGAIRRIGFSFHGGPGQFRELVDSWDWDFCQIQFNYMDENSQAGLSGLRYAHSRGIPVIIMEPLRGGKLAAGFSRETQRIFDTALPRRSPVDWSLRWIWDHPEVTCILSGMNDTAQVEENCRIASDSLPLSLTEEEKAVYPRLLESMRSSVRIGCTGCGYCQPCPRGVDIPTCFAIYNTSYIDGFFNGMKEYMMCTTLRRVRSNAGLCVRCGKCEAACPQHLEIREGLQQVCRRLENPLYKIASWAAPAFMKY